jgi:hypothetical protein
MFSSSSSDKKLLAVFASAYNDKNSVITLGKLLISLSILSISLNFKARNISDTAINSISNQVVSRMRLGFPAGATIPLTAPGMWYSTADNNFHVFAIWF